MSMKTQRRGRLVGLGAALAVSTVLLAGCMGNAGSTSSSAGSDAATTDNGSATLAMPTEPANIDPIMMRSLSAWNMYYAVFDGLTRIDAKGKIQPGLATDWKSNSTQDVWTFTIRKGVKFQDGSELKVSDIVYTYDKILASDKSTNRVAIAMISKVEATDDHTVQFTLKNPFSAWLNQVATIGIVPEKVYEAEGPEKFPNAPVGTGPYSFVAWNHGVDYKVTRNDDYWGDKAKIKDITFSFVGAPDARVTGVESGSLDTAIIPASQVPVFDGAANAKVIEAASNQVAFIGVNTTAGALSNLKVRQAIPLAIDRKSIVESLLNGYASPTGEPVAKGVTGYVDGFSTPKYDPAAAKKLVEESGYDGAEITLQYPSTGGSPTDPEVAQAIAADLGKAGLKIKLVGAEQSSLSLSLANHQITGLYLNYWSPSSMDGDVVVSQLLAGGPEDYARSPEMAQAYLDQQAANADKRTDVFKKIWEWNATNVSNVPLWQNTNAYATASTISWTPAVDGIYRAAEIGRAAK
ncbi:ABC transporter substrate-binding protein [Microbacterium azadirachtae]|uniref:Glutathione-binding protein GsiB n=1 Tax=Microbacterium azadirachtae TaxID=582680 RepID=A0A0F0LHI5_9MICO|nr:ABC transporter substrate-binding protein [Microbacterium azadirachtae]KJL32129.1 Glutathione-binding protein GsiB precursor [Microbacterium azadirachtae]